ncbi:Short-chain dehydrogenase/reductase family protein [Mycena sanguinolenta]|uniref:Short-chain dehydrogenase/reductase family protein n=1 Tax=Mycena sanguinolenta TaxID=230812 RepID=A0A8H6YFM8_9AGAR|nr:Short-chain dehydrogenase/reductase family protein [Mycena sanguinolenta]
MAQSTFSSTTTAEEVGIILSDEIRGKNGSASANGIGFETARILAKHANLVIIAGRNPDRLKIAEDAIKNEVPAAKIQPLILDLSSLAAVRKAAAEVREPLHVLIHNAAATIEPFKLTADGIETQMATNHVGPFLLTKLLSSQLLATRTRIYTPRVIFVSASGHAFCDGINFKTLEKPDPASYEAMNTYFQTKVANILTGIELSKRSRGKINAYSLHPGVIYTNLMQKGEAVAGLQKLGALDADGKPSNKRFTFKTIPQGAATTMTAAFDPKLNDTPGAYLNDCVVANEAIAPHGSDPRNAETLWNLTEQIIGESFVF